MPRCQNKGKKPPVNYGLKSGKSRSCMTIKSYIIFPLLWQRFVNTRTYFLERT